jgi:hypothetical protein
MANRWVNEGTQPIIRHTFYDQDNTLIVPTTCYYTITRRTGASVVSATTITPATTVNVVIPVAGVTLVATDRNPVEMIYTLSITYPDGTQKTEELSYLVVPLAGV